MDNDINREINIEQVEFGIDIENTEYTIEINPRDTFAVELNEQGPQGARGFTGNGISSYELTSSSGLTDTYTITFTDGNTTTVNVTNGRGITSITGPVSVGNVDTYTINYNDSTTSTFIVTNGIDGVNPTVTVGSTTTGLPGTNASVINSGTTQDVILDFTIPRGDKGDTGTAATITVGTVTTGLPTDPASVTNVGTSSAAIFDFTIPKGDKGDTGATGNGIINTEKVSTVGLVDTYHINYTNGNYDSFDVTNGRDGTGAVTDVTVNGTSVLDGNVAKVIVPTDNLQLTNGAGYITGITSGDVTTALGYTPYNATNPNGYITTSALSGYATETWVGNQGYLTTVPTATTLSLGAVQPDGVTITIDENGVISGAAQGANVDLSNLSTAGNARLQYAPFAINAGSILNGKNNTLTYSGSDITCDTCTLTTCDGRTKVFNTVSTLDISVQADGDYSILKDYTDGSLSLISSFSIGASKNWQQPTLTTNGTPLTDNFAVSASSEYSYSGTTYNCWKGTYGSGQSIGWASSNDFVLGQENSWYQLAFKDKIKISQLSLNSFQLGSYIYYIVNYVIKASNDGTNWTSIYTGTNTAGATTNTFTIPVNSLTAYHYYRIIPTSIGIGTTWTIQNLKIEATFEPYNHINISTTPANLYINGTLNNDLVYIGDCTVSSGAVTSITNRKFNDSGYFINPYPLEGITPDWSSITAKTWDTEYIADKEGWVICQGSVGSYSPNYITINNIQFPLSASSSSSASSGFQMPVGIGDTYKATGTQGNSVLYFVEMRGN